MKKQSNGQPVAAGLEDLLQKLGYKRPAPRIGSVGRALLKASKNQRSDNFLKKYWDSYFKKLRKQRKGRNKRYEKQNGRLNISSNVRNNPRESR